VEKQLWFLQHDNAPAHASLLIRDFLANTNTTVFPQPLYSPDMAPAHFFFISQTEIHFERKTISDDSRDYGKCAAGAARNPEKGVPGLFL
jgi:transposase